MIWQVYTSHWSKLLTLDEKRKNNSAFKTKNGLWTSGLEIPDKIDWNWDAPSEQVDIKSKYSSPWLEAAGGLDIMREQTFDSYLKSQMKSGLYSRLNYPVYSFSGSRDLTEASTSISRRGSRTSARAVSLQVRITAWCQSHHHLPQRPPGRPLWTPTRGGSTRTSRSTRTASTPSPWGPATCRASPASRWRRLKSWKVCC